MKRVTCTPRLPLHSGNTEARNTRKPFRALRRSALPRSIPPVRCTLLRFSTTDFSNSTDICIAETRRRGPRRNPSAPSAIPRYRVQIPLSTVLRYSASMAQRKPTSMSCPTGRARLALRTPSALSPYDPPRITRFLPESGPSGLRSGD